MKRINFYFKYAWRSVLRGGQRSFFAVLCVAVGVAALVALQALGASIQDTLTGDAKARAGGDINLSPGNSNRLERATAAARFSQNDFDTLNRYKADGTIVEWAPLTQNTLQLKGYFSFPPSLYVVDPNTYPLYGSLEILEPKGKSLKELLSQPNAVIISKNLWEKQNYKLGQEIEVSGTNGQSGKLKIVAESNVDLPGVIFGNGQFFGYGMTSPQTASTFFSAEDLQPYLIFVKTKSDAVTDSVLRTLKSSGQFRGQTVQEIQTQLTRGLDITKDFLSYIGLLSLLVGGIGVINTMLVVIGRRASEIATVKALGLKTRQTLFIFTLEALILGLGGSILGVVLGELLGLGIKGVAEGFFARPLNWGLYPTPIIVGLLVGVLTSAVFGFLPAYAAAKVRPAIVLRAQSSFIPRVGGIASFVILLIMGLLLGVIAGVLLGNILLGIIISLVTLVVFLILVGLLWLVIAAVGLIPAPPNPSVKMAFRSFSRNRGRTATTVLVMIVGLFFISFITFVADSVKATIKDAFDIQLGYNAVGFNLAAGSLVGQPDLAANDRTLAKLKEVPGLQKVFTGNFANARLETINGAIPLGGTSSVDMSGRGYVNGEAPGAAGKQKVLAGRNLTPEDADKNVVMIKQTVAQNYNLKPGDKVTLRAQSTFGGGRNSQPNNTVIEFEIIGVLDAGNQVVNFERDWIAPFNSVAKLGAPVTLYYMFVDRTQKQASLEAVQGVIFNVFDLDDLINTFSRILDQFLAFPLILSLLSLFSGAILVANNVALAVLERRTEIGVLKAVGAKRRRVMGILLWESGLVGLLGGLIGVGFGVLIAINVNNITGTARASLNITWSPLTAVLLLLLGVGLAIFATIVSAWGAVQEKPLVVLRYE